MCMDATRANFATTEATTSYKDRLAVMVEADYNEEQGGATAKVVRLTRLHNELHSGVALDENTQETIRTLTKELGVQNPKSVSVSQDTNRGRRGQRQQVILTDPLGMYHTKLSMDFTAYRLPDVCKLWDANPIEAIEVSMIPGRCMVDDLASHRLGRCLAVTLHFVEPSFTKVFNLLVNPRIRLATCRVLELRNITMTESESAILKKRLNWPSLQNITNGKRAT